jgi:hypothetical protein
MSWPAAPSTTTRIEPEPQTRRDRGRRRSTGSVDSAQSKLERSGFWAAPECWSAGRWSFRPSWAAPECRSAGRRRSGPSWRLPPRKAIELKPWDSWVRRPRNIAKAATSPATRPKKRHGSRDAAQREGMGRRARQAGSEASGPSPLQSRSVRIAAQALRSTYGCLRRTPTARSNRHAARTKTC